MQVIGGQDVVGAPGLAAFDRIELRLAVADAVTGGALEAALAGVAGFAGAVRPGDPGAAGALFGPPAPTGPGATVELAERAAALLGAEVGLAVTHGAGVLWVAVVTPEAWRPHGHRLDPGATPGAVAALALGELAAALG